MPKQETFTLISLQHTLPEAIANGLYSASTPVPKNAGEVYWQKYEAAMQAGISVTFQFYSPAGYLIEVPIVDLQVAQYDDSFPNDHIDVVIYLRPEEIALLTLPDESLFGY